MLRPGPGFLFSDNVFTERVRSEFCRILKISKEVDIFMANLKSKKVFGDQFKNKSYTLRPVKPVLMRVNVKV